MQKGENTTQTRILVLTSKGFQGLDRLRMQSRIVQMIREFCGGSCGISGEISGLADEISSNAVIHGGARNLTIRIRRTARNLSLLLLDDGLPFNPVCPDREIPVPVGTAPGRRGLHMMRQAIQHQPGTEILWREAPQGNAAVIRRVVA